MDLRAIVAQPAPEEAAVVDAVLGADAPLEAQPLSLREVRARRHLLLPVLHAIQRRSGFISEGALGYACRRLGLPPAEGYGVATFYAAFQLSPRPPRVVHVCDDLACRARGAERLVEQVTSSFGPAGSARDGATWQKSPCLGLCEHAPAALLVQAGAQPFEQGLARVDLSVVSQALREGSAPAIAPTVPAQPLGERVLLRRAGAVDPTSLDDYRAHGGYRALRRAFELGPAGVIREVTDARLLGRGGAAFPTGKKWAAVAAQAARPHYLVANADESEPGTFKDRVLLEEDPFALIEAMTIAAYATGCEHGFIYLRAEYPRAAERVAHAIDAARRRGLLGADIMGRGLYFDLELRRGAGAYICGEETALFRSIEGFRGEPKNKPPFPVEVGLFGQPTVINNVETLVNVLDIVADGAAAFVRRGTSASTGTRLFCLSGHVEHPGIYEVPFGTRLDALIALAGGVPGGKKIRAVLLGGAAGTFLGPDQLHVPLTFEDTRKIGATLGSGVVLVLDETVELWPMLLRIAEFFRDESCGQCVPCRVGTVRVEELLERLARGAPIGSVDDERQLLTELSQAMRDASICGLGQTATSAIESAIDLALVSLPTGGNG